MKQKTDRIIDLLNSVGFDTTDEVWPMLGELNDESEGRVVVMLRDNQNLIDSADLIFDLLKQEGVLFNFAEGPFIQANYSPIDGCSFIDIYYISDDMLGRSIKDLN